MTSKSSRFITLELIRKRSEHNEGLVSTLEELALHQEELQSIGPILGRTCGKTLKILLLQNNVIERMIAKELKMFKSLEYFNLALNNIHCIEQGSLSGMEWLRKLDLTLNFIDVDCLETSVDELGQCRSLEELFLIGNPCMGLSGGGGDALPKELTASSTHMKEGWSKCRVYVVARLPNLKYLDGIEIKRSERIIASKQLPELATQLKELARQREKERQRHLQLKKEEEEDGDNDEDTSSSYISEEALTQHDPETRTKISNEAHDQKMAKIKQAEGNAIKHKGEKEWEEEHKDAVDMERARSNCVDKEESLRSIKQCNQGKYNFWFDERRSESGIETLIMCVDVPKHLSTSLIDVDIHPTYVSIVIKNKILRVILPVEVVLDGAVARRSAASGNLELVMPKMNPKEIVVGLNTNLPKNAKDKVTKGRSKTQTSTKSAPTGRRREFLGRKMMDEVKGLSPSTFHEEGGG
jgi:protein TilB